MLTPSDRGDALGGKHCIQTDFFEEVVSGDSKDIAEVLDGDELQVVELFVDALDVEDAILGKVVRKDALFVDVLPASLKVYQSNSVIEDAFYFLYLAQLFFEAFYSFLHHPL